MNMKRIMFAVIGISALASLFIMLQDFGLSKHGIHVLLMFSAGAAILWAIYFSQAAKVLQEGIPAVRGSLLWFFRNLGLVFVGIGALLVLGNLTGSMPTFPFAGATLITLGVGLLAYLLAKAAQTTASTGKTSSAGEQNPSTAVFMKVLNEKRKSDPLIGGKVAGKEIFQRLLRIMKDNKGIHIESLLCALGALAGYSCQASLRAHAVEKGMPDSTFLLEVNTSIGKKYFFGDALNNALAESQYSIWSFAAGMAQHNGCKDLPDLNDIFAHVSDTVGKESFGVPRLPEGHNTGDLPINYLKVLWPALFPVAKEFCPNPAEWPILFGIAIQEALNFGKDVLAAEIAVLIVMESAIPMSKIDLEAA